MRWGDYYQNRLGLENEEQVFNYLIQTLKATNRRHGYFVDWQKVNEQVAAVETEIHMLDVLIGKANIKEEAQKLFSKYPTAMSAVPVLIAERSKNLTLLDRFTTTQYLENKISFSETSDPREIAEFLAKTGFLAMLEQSRIKSVMDYVTGVEGGLDSNGRKNRGGKAMEFIIGALIDEMCRARSWKMMTEATKKKIESEWEYEISIGNANKRIDFAVNTGTQLFLIETNFYSAGGSKLKSTANEYSAVWNTYGHPFIWITDGFGWKNDKSLRDAFAEIDHILNIDMVQNRILEMIILGYLSVPADSASRPEVARTE